MKKLKIILFSLLFLYISINTTAQTVDDIINKHIEAVGGLDNLKAINTIKMTGKFGMGAFEAPVTIIIKRPNMFKMVFDYQGNSMIVSYDGEVAWQQNPWSGKPDPEKLPAERIKDLKENADIDGPMVNYKEKGYTAELMGKEDMEGSEVYKIRLTDKDNDVNYFFIDTQSYLMLKSSTKRKIKEKEEESDQYYGNYQKFGGVMMPLSVEYRDKGETTGQTSTIETVELNIEIDDSVFKMPEEKK